MTRSLRVQIDAAVRELRAGRVVVMPTDTVYGIAARPDLQVAVDRVFELKGRSEDKPLPVLAASVEDLERVVVLDDDARAVATRYWPGPLTLVLPRREAFGAELGGRDRDTVAVRIPQSDVALALLRQAGPLAVTSANRSGEPAAATTVEARAYFGDRVAVYLDDGPADGRASTVASMVDDLRVLREGPISLDDLRQIVTS